MTTMAFNKFFAEEVDIYRSNPNSSGIRANWYIASKLKGAMFDARVFNIPKEEVTNLIFWRQLDAARNSVQMVGQAYFSHKELQNKSCSDIQDMLMEKYNINWNDFPTTQKRGSCCIKNVDLDGLQEGIGNVQRVLGVMQDFTKKDKVEKPTYKPRPLYKHFED